jgi:hypothetical protein
MTIWFRHPALREGHWFEPSNSHVNHCLSLILGAFAVKFLIFVISNFRIQKQKGNFLPQLYSELDFLSF